jgi:hypothetical protein
MARRVVLGVVGAIPGALVGAGVGLFGGYGLAQRVGVTSAETQAYFQVLIAFPLLGVIGLISGAAALAALPSPRSPGLAATAGLGGLALLATCVAGITWHHAARPASVRVRNDAPSPIEQVYLGGDFRRASDVGTLATGESSRALEVDLDQPGSFAELRGRWRGEPFHLPLDPAQRDTLTEGRWLYVVQSAGETLTLAIRAD